jgi:thiamine pyrophosphokinase
MNALIIANGTLPGKSIVLSTLETMDYIVCADGGANSARKLRIVPDIILGDFDSITESTKKYYRNVTMRRIADQDSTDLEKAIRHCIEQRHRTVWIIGATGSRLDHTTGALGCFKKFRWKANLIFIDTEGALSLIKKSVTIKTEEGEQISLIPLDRCEGVTTTNLKYKLNDDILELGVREGISNVATGSEVKISVHQGTLLLYRFHKAK